MRIVACYAPSQVGGASGRLGRWGILRAVERHAPSQVGGAPGRLGRWGILRIVERHAPNGGWADTCETGSARELGEETV